MSAGDQEREVGELADQIASLPQSKIDEIVLELDERVHDLKGNEAAAINNSGIHSQIEYVGPEVAREVLQELLI